jgi:hypothetical protein
MKTTLCTWEDETSNRQVQFSIGFTNENGTVAIESVTPHKVSFVCPTSNTLLRSVGVHTRSGREFLAAQFRSSQAFAKLAAVINNSGNELPMPNFGIRADVCSA